MSEIETEHGPVHFSQLDRQTVFKLPSKPETFFIRVAKQHCQNIGKESCNHVCVVFPNPETKGWDIRWMENQEMADSEQVIPVGTAQ
jgi:hypothetical protein